MRLIGTIPSEANAHRFSAYLTRQGIANRCEGEVDSDSHVSFQIWVADEDRLQEAHQILQQFMVNPADPRFDLSLIEPTEENRSFPEDKKIPLKRQVSTPVTMVFLGLCVFVFILNAVQELALREEGLPKDVFFMTPIQLALLYDVPPIIEKLDVFAEEHKIPQGQKPEELSPDLKSQLEDLENNTPYWQGIYDLIVFKAKTGSAALARGPMFMKIREGEIWRLFSPCVMHSDFIHILFNMIWLWVLGRPIEQRIGALRTLSVTLFVGIAANTAQYLMSGPLFLGYSGVVMGLAGFIWMRERIAPWEGYPLQRVVFLFLFIFILAMFVLQTISFFIQIFTTLPFPFAIANTAHIVGALLGIFLGRFSYFAWRVK